MKILQKLKFMFARRGDTPTEVRPDDMTSKKHGVCSADGKCCEVPSGDKKEDGCCDHGCDCK